MAAWARLRLVCRVRPAALLLYESPRERLLRLVTLVCSLPVAVAAWLIPLAPREEWARAPLGDLAWWLWPAGLIGLALVLPASLWLLHERYVLRLTLERDDALLLTTFLLWGRRTKRYTIAQFNGRRLIFDPAGDAPHGMEFAVAPAAGPWFSTRPRSSSQFVSRCIRS